MFIYRGMRLGKALSKIETVQFLIRRRILKVEFDQEHQCLILYY